MNAIVAASENNGIGMNGTLPWRLKKEMQHFARLTKRVPAPDCKEVDGATSLPACQNGVVMGRNTWTSIPDRFRPLTGRLNYVLTSNSSFSAPGAIVCHSMDEVLKDFEGRGATVDTLWAIGGSSVYKTVFASPSLHRVYLTQVLRTVECDTFLPPLPEGLTEVTDPDVPTEVQEEGDFKYLYKVWERSS